MIAINSLFENLDDARNKFWNKQVEYSKNSKQVPGSVGEREQKKITDATKNEAKGKYPK